MVSDYKGLDTTTYHRKSTLTFHLPEPPYSLHIFSPPQPQLANKMTDGGTEERARERSRSRSRKRGGDGVDDEGGGLDKQTRAMITNMSRTVERLDTSSKEIQPKLRDMVGDCPSVQMEFENEMEFKKKKE